MDYKMELVALLLSVIPAFITSITITSNGNSPEIKMMGGMMVDVQKGFVPMESKVEETIVRASRENKRNLNNTNSTKLSINERYRRLIPYMTFYYANDFAKPTTDDVKEVEVEKAEIVEASGYANQREPKKILFSTRNIPRYQGNRLTQHNIASANPTKVFYKGGVPIYETPNKLSQNYNPSLTEYNAFVRNSFDTGRIVRKQIPKSPEVSFLSSTRKPYLNLYPEDTPNIRYYLSEKEETPKYKLVPYEQTPPVKVPENDNYYDINRIPVPLSVLIAKEQVYLKPRPIEPHYVYDSINVQRATIRKQPAIISESYYEKQRPPVPFAQPVVHSGFKPILNSPQYTQEDTVYTTNVPETVTSDTEHLKQQDVLIQSSPEMTDDFKRNYYKYILDQSRPSYKPQRVTPSYTVPLASILDSLQLNKSIPKPITKENVGASIRTLLQVLNALKVVPQQNNVDPPILIIPKPLMSSKLTMISKPDVHPETERPFPQSNEDLHDTAYLAPVHTPSQHLDDQSRASYEPPRVRPSYTVQLASILDSLQLNKSIPKPITKENVGASIRTLLQVLNVLKVVPQQNNVDPPILSTPKPFVASKLTIIPKPDVHPETERPFTQSTEDLHDTAYLAPVHTPSQHLDDIPPDFGTSQQFPLPQSSDDEGGTPGRPGVDYPILTTIPPTSFDCKTQRYKGFFGDPETRCQVWHYCDLNGGQASFLCPNGTIFSQAALTCDWWFNVRCAATTQLYVLNESLYKYILPHSPKFPEDFSGPLVDKYLTLKFKEMEEEFKKNKNKQSASEKLGSEEESNDSSQGSIEKDDFSEHETVKIKEGGENAVSEASVTVDSPGESGKVERLHD